MRFSSVVLAISLLALVGCGQPKSAATRDPTTGEEGKVTISAKDGVARFETADGAARFESGANVKAPQDLPPFVEIYPGLRLENVITGEGGGSAGGGVLVGFSGDPPDTVAAFYREVIKKRAMRTVLDRAANGTIVLNATSGDAATLNLTITPKDGGSTIGLTYGAVEK